MCCALSYRTNYETDYQRGYGGVPLEAYRGGGERKKEMKVVIEDSRAAHFSLGACNYTCYVSYVSSSCFHTFSISNLACSDVYPIKAMISQSTCPTRTPP
ncbi:hypothetical protein EON64_10480 [archaeon]|nr:MAG: hypothetical protein EON64_10480 [archaeon]